ncbi:MAG: sigma-70 family RNA polymerase sigma factor [Bryobacterales bacterium]|nr:sigma-70 family RNA polymerase sigma factor [Bryobacterales bacterium]
MEGAEITQLLVRWKQGDHAAESELTPVLYRELHRLAERYLRDEHAARTLQPTALVNELYLGLVAKELPDWESRAHFFGIAAHRMRQILVEHARKRATAKRGSGADKVPLDEMVCFAPGRSRELLALDDAITALAQVDARKAKVIELRYFAGLSVEETGEMLGISVATVGREQRFAEAFLRREMSGAAATE